MLPFILEGLTDMIPQFLFCIRQWWLVHLLSVSYLFLFSLVLSIFFSKISPDLTIFYLRSFFFFFHNATMMRNAAGWFQSQALTLFTGFAIWAVLCFWKMG